MKRLIIVFISFILISCSSTNGIIDSKTNKERELKKNKQEFYKPKPSKNRFQQSSRYNR